MNIHGLCSNPSLINRATLKRLYDPATLKDIWSDHLSRLHQSGLFHVPFNFDVKPAIELSSLSRTTEPSFLERAIELSSLSRTTEPSSLERATEPPTLEQSTKTSSLDPEIKPVSLEQSTKPTSLDPEIKPTSLEPTIKVTTLELAPEPSSLKPAIEPSSPDLELASNYNLIKILASSFQTAYGAFELYNAVGNQLDKYGYAAYALTVVPYTMMSFVNLLASLCQPQYPSKFIVTYETSK